MREYRLIKRSGSPRWYITWTEGRRSVRIPTGTEDHGQALQVLHLFALENERPKEAKPGDLAIAQVLGWYWDERASKLPSKEQAGIAIKRFNEFFGLARVSAIDKPAHDRYLKMRQDAGVRWQTINRERMVLRAALNHARRHHGLITVPHIPTISQDDADAAPVEPRGRPLTIPELAALFRATKSDHMRVFLLVMLGTLCRPDAAKNLEIAGQCDFTHKLIDLNPKGRKQTKKRRPVVPMVQFLEKELSGAKSTYAVEYYGEPIISTKTAWRLLRDAAGLGKDVNPYSIRHTVSRYLRRAKVPGDQISVMLGHRPAGTSRTDLVYAPYEPGYCGEAAAAIDRLYREIIREVARQTRANRPVENDKSKKTGVAGKRDNMRVT